MHITLTTDLSTLQPASLDAGQIFSGKPSGKLIQSYAAPTSYTTTIDSDYIFHESSRDIIVWLMNKSDPLYVFGLVGSGKSSSLKQLAARLNYPTFEVTGHGRLEFADLVGHLAVKDGNMVFENGPLALAMCYGCLVILNEIDLTPTRSRCWLEHRAGRLSTLGSKRIAPPPESLRIFGTLKARAFNFLDRHGVRFMSGRGDPCTPWRQ